MRVFVGAVLAFFVLTGLSGAARAANLAAMQPAEIEALQKRLTGDGCYKGAIDGQASQSTADAIKACPNQDPVLRIDTGMHTARINEIGVDSGCRLMATGSVDKTVRLWALPEGRLLRTIRLPIDVGNEGKVLAVALSPDGSTLAVGGWDPAFNKGMGTGLYLVDIASGSVRRFGAFENVIQHLAFSADGARIAIGLGGHGVRVIDRNSGRELMADRDYGGDVYGLAFAPDGSLFATGFDGYLRHYGPDLRPRLRVKAPGGRRPFAVAVDPTGRRVAVGYEDATVVSVLDAATFKPLIRVDVADVTNGNLHALAWTADGRQLVAGGSAEEHLAGPNTVFLRRFGLTGKHPDQDNGVAQDIVTDVKSCGAGVAFSAADPAFGLIGNDGRAHSLQDRVTVDMRLKLGDAFTISADGSAVRFGLGPDGDRPVLFDLAAGTLVDSPASAPGFNLPVVDTLRITDWQDDKPKLDGQPLPLKEIEVSRSLAIRPDRAGFVLGTEFSVRAFETYGAPRWVMPAPGVAWGVNLTAGGRLVVAAYSDGTVRWHRWSDGQEVLALFVNAISKTWVAWTPTGYYMASPGGEDMIGWHVNRGWDQQADFFPASRFRDRFDRPDIVRLVLTTLDEAEAVKQADAAAGKRREDSRPLIERLPPVITILSPADGASVAPGPVEIRYGTRLPSGGRVDRVEAFVDGARIEARGLARADADAGASPDPGTLSLPMPAHDAVISLVAYADGKASDAARLELKGIGPAAGVADDALKPSLYALLIGVTHYDNAAFDLGYPAQDAQGLAEALKTQEGKLYRHVEVKLLTDKDATSLGVKRGLSWLRRQTTARDLAVVFAAGHGMTDAKGKFWFLTSDADPQELTTSAVSQQDIADVLYDLPGKKLLFLDACHSGAALNAGARGLERTDLGAAINDFAQTEGGVVAYAASTGKEFSLERDEWRHGAFTKALIEGFEGKADLLHNGTVTTATLDAFLEERVKQLTQGAQHPVMTRPKIVPDFPVAAVN